MLRYLLVAAFAVTSLGDGVAAAQSEGRTSVTDYRSWYMYFGDHPIGDGGWGVHFDGQFRVHGLGDSRSQTLLRPGINFDLNDTVQFSGGYAYIDTSAGEGSAPGFNVPENRLWEQLILWQRLGRTGLVHRYRLEQRFVGNKVPNDVGEGTLDGHTYRNRFRYFLKASIPIGTDTRYSAQLYNELMINFGKNVQNNFFDQNRSYAAFGINMGRAGRLELGYLLQLVQQGSGSVIEYNHALQIGFFSTVPIGR